MYNSLRKIQAKRHLSIISATLILILFFSGFQTRAQSEGEQLFQVCSACHTIGKGKLIGPDLKGVTERLDNAWLISFIRNSQEMVAAGDEYAVKTFEEYKIPMPPNDLTDDQINVLLDYITNFDPDAAAVAPAEVSQTGEADAHAIEKETEFMGESERPYDNLRISFIICMVLIGISLFDLMFTHLIKAKVIPIMVILISLAIVVEVVIVEAQALGRQQYYEPDQPIAFSHKVHAGDNQIDCQYCHFTAEESRHAGIPPVQLCMNCHNVVKSGTHTGTEEIAKISAAIDNNQPIEWIKVHNLPDHVYFNHAQHVNVGNIACEQCHGDVSEMDRIMQVEDLSMGWCINCHRNTQVQFESNEFYTDYEGLHEKLKNGELNRITVTDIGGNDCQKCHY